MTDKTRAQLTQELTMLRQRVAELEAGSEQAFLASIYQGVELAIFVVDVSAEGEFHFAGLNPAHERLTGLKSKEVQGKRPEELAPVVPLEATAELRAHYARCLEGGQAIEYEEKIPIGGRETWWLTRLTPLHNSEGRIYRIVGTSVSITGRKQTEGALRESEERFASLLHSLADVVVWAASADGTEFYYCNDATERVYGRPAAEFLANPDLWSEVVHPDDQARVAQGSQRLLEEGQVEAEYRIARPDGEVRWLSDRKYVVYDDDGEPLRIGGIATDVTERVRAQEALHRASVSRVLVGEVLRDLQSMGGVSEAAMFQAGQALAARVEADSLPAYLSAYADMGLGTLTLAQTDEARRRWVFVGEGLVEREAGSPQPTCNYSRGYLCSAVTHAQGGLQVAAVEMACQSMGDESCRFVVQAV